MARKPLRRAGSKRVPWWVTMDMTPLYVVGLIVLMLGVAALVGRTPPKGSIHACIDAYAAAVTKADSEQVDVRRPFDSPKMRGASCGALKGTPAYVRILREQQEHATRPAPRGHA